MKQYDAYELLKASGARLPIDSLKFVDPILNIDTAFARDFYLAGVTHYLSCKGLDCALATDLERGDELFLKKEPSNSYDELAIEIVNSHGQRVGYVPRYYRDAFQRLLDEQRTLSCHVKRIEKTKLYSECVYVHVEVSAKK